jgi:hypothetical protein
MSTHDDLPPGARVTAPRGWFLRSLALAGAGLACAGMAPGLARAAGTSPGGSPDDTALDVLDTLLLAEQIALTCYYTGRTTSHLTAHPGTPSVPAVADSLAYLSTTLAHEYEHARILAGLGASASARRFYFPRATFDRVGFTSRPGTFLWMLDHLETLVAGLYLAASKRFAELGRDDLSILAMRILGVECEHRALYRVISLDDPADNITLEVGQFQSVGAAAATLVPFVTGRGLGRNGGRMIPLPSNAAIDELLRAYQSG